MDEVTPEFVQGVQSGVAAVKARIAALRAEIARLEASIGGEPDYSTPKPPAADARARLPDRPGLLADELQHARDANARQLAAFRRLGYGAVPPPPAGEREMDRAIMETKMRTNQPTGAPTDIQALRALMRQGPGVASAR